MADSPAIKEAIRQIEKRLSELREDERVSEYLALVEFAEKFHGFIYSPSAADEPRVVVRPTGEIQRTPKRTTTPRRAPKAASGQTADSARSGHGETLQRIREIVASHPEGISVADIIEEGQLSQSYTYDVVKRLVERGEFHRANRKIYPQTQFKHTRQRPASAVRTKTNA